MVLPQLYRHTRTDAKFIFIGHMTRHVAQEHWVKGTGVWLSSGRLWTGVSPFTSAIWSGHGPHNFNAHHPIQPLIGLNTKVNGKNLLTLFLRTRQPAPSAKDTGLTPRGLRRDVVSDQSTLLHVLGCVWHRGFRWIMRITRHFIIGSLISIVSSPCLLRWDGQVEKPVIPITLPLESAPASQNVPTIWAAWSTSSDSIPVVCQKHLSAQLSQIDSHTA